MDFLPGGCHWGGCLRRQEVFQALKATEHGVRVQSTTRRMWYLIIRLAPSGNGLDPNNASTRTFLLPLISFGYAVVFTGVVIVVGNGPQFVVRNITSAFVTDGGWDKIELAGTASIMHRCMYKGPIFAREG